MPAQLPDISYKGMCAVRDKANALFENRRITFIRTAIPLNPGQVDSPLVEEENHPIQVLHIEKTDTPALYERIMNATKFQEIVSMILRVDTPKLLQQIQLLLKDHQEAMPSDVTNNIQIIYKYVVQFQKRLQMTLRTSFEECNDVAAVQEKARDILTKSFKDGLISYVMPALLAGLKTNPNYYKWLVGYFRDFLEQYGIYTQVYNINQEIDYEFLTPEIVQVTDNESLHGKIADLLLLPYFFNDERYNGHALLSEGLCVAWRFEN